MSPRRTKAEVEHLMIRVWHFGDAPPYLQALSPHGGDEDWLAVVPRAILAKDPRISWLDSGGPFGCYDVSRHEREADVVFIGAHS